MVLFPPLSLEQEVRFVFWVAGELATLFAKGWLGLCGWGAGGVL